jgi:acyl-CoA thioester hydrolase
VSKREIIGVEVVRGEVAGDWIDVNGHMNVANYLQAFDKAVVHLRQKFGVTEDYVRAGRSTFAVECHMTYQQELRLGDPYCITAQVLAYNSTGIHQFNRMYHANEHFLAATAESMTLHVDLGERRVVPWPDEILASISGLSDEQGKLSHPLEAGRRIRIRNPIFTTEPDAND